MSTFESRQVRGDAIKRSGRPMAEVLDELILAPGAGSLDVIGVMMVAFDLGLGEAKGLVGGRCHELKNKDNIAASEAWVAAKVEELIRSAGPGSDWLGDLLDQPTSGHTPWEPTGIVERIEVVERFLGMTFQEANDVVTKRIHEKKTAAGKGRTLDVLLDFATSGGPPETKAELDEALRDEGVDPDEAVARMRAKLGMKP